MGTPESAEEFVGAQCGRNNGVIKCENQAEWLISWPDADTEGLRNTSVLSCTECLKIIDKVMKEAIEDTGAKPFTYHKEPIYPKREN